jgi:hypothetical protein
MLFASNAILEPQIFVQSWVMEDKNTAAYLDLIDMPYLVTRVVVIVRHVFFFGAILFCSCSLKAAPRT